MLDKIIIHLKNIIFFKSVVYVMITFGLLILMPVFQEDLQDSKLKREKAKGYVSETNIKLSSITDFENNIKTTNKRYLNLLKSSELNECFDRNQFKNQIVNLLPLTSTPENYENLEIKIAKISLGDDKRNSSDIKIHTYEVDISFNTESYSDFAKFSELLWEALPKGTVILSTELEHIQTLTPSMIRKLSESSTPKLFIAKLKLLIREVAYEKRN